MRVRTLLYPLAGAAAWLALAGSPAAADDEVPATPEPASTAAAEAAEVTPLDAWLAEQQAAHEQRMAEHEARMAEIGAELDRRADEIAERIRCACADLPGLPAAEDELPVDEEDVPVDELPAEPVAEPVAPEVPATAPEPVDEQPAPRDRWHTPAEWAQLTEDRWTARGDRITEMWEAIPDSPTPGLATVGATLGTVTEVVVAPVLEAGADLLGPTARGLDHGLAYATDTLRTPLQWLRCATAWIWAPLQDALDPTVEAVRQTGLLGQTLDPVLDVVVPGSPRAPDVPGQPVDEQPTAPVPALPVGELPSAPVPAVPLPVDEQPTAPAPVVYADQLVPAAATSAAAADVDQAADTDPAAYPAGEPGSSSTGAGGSSSGAGAADADAAGTLALQLTPGRRLTDVDEHADGLTLSITPRPA